MAIEVPQNEEISAGRKNGGRKGIVLPSVGEERIGGRVHYEMIPRRSCLERC